MHKIFKEKISLHEEVRKVVSLTHRLYTPVTLTPGYCFSGDALVHCWSLKSRLFLLAPPCPPLQTTSQTELENWITAIHSACAAAVARHHHKEDTLRLLKSEIKKLEQKIDMDEKMKKMGEMQLSSVTDSKKKKTILDQVIVLLRLDLGGIVRCWVPPLLGITEHRRLCGSVVVSLSSRLLNSLLWLSVFLSHRSQPIVRSRRAQILHWMRDRNLIEEPSHSHRWHILGHPWNCQVCNLPSAPSLVDAELGCGRDAFLTSVNLEKVESLLKNAYVVAVSEPKYKERFREVTEDVFAFDSLVSKSPIAI